MPLKTLFSKTDKKAKYLKNVAAHESKANNSRNPIQSNRVQSSCETRGGQISLLLLFEDGELFGGLFFDLITANSYSFCLFVCQSLNQKENVFIDYFTYN